jgi:hypothetical protein
MKDGRAKITQAAQQVFFVVLPILRGVLYVYSLLDYSILVDHKIIKRKNGK